MQTDTAAVAGLFADRSRLAMLDVLLDGREHAVGALAEAAGIAASTATEHLGRLEEGASWSPPVAVGSVSCVSQPHGRGGIREALAELSGEAQVRGLRAWTRREELRAARTCYDHLAGRLGVSVADAGLAAGALEEDFTLGSTGPAWFSRLGVDLDALSPGRRPLLRVCTDWTERREHLAGALGAAVCSAVLHAGWAVRRPSSRAIHVTPLGRSELGRLGITAYEFDAGRNSSRNGIGSGSGNRA